LGALELKLGQGMDGGQETVTRRDQQETAEQVFRNVANGLSQME
jgi:hypothetical protein